MFPTISRGRSMPKNTKTFRKVNTQVIDGLTFFTYESNIGSVIFARVKHDTYTHETNIKTRKNLAHDLIAKYHDLVLDEKNTDTIEVENE